MIPLPNKGYKMCTKDYVIDKLEASRLNYIAISLQQLDVICAYYHNIIVFLSADLKHRFIIRLEKDDTDKYFYNTVVMSNIFDSYYSILFFNMCESINMTNINRYMIVETEIDSVCVRIPSFSSVIIKYTILRKLIMHDICYIIFKTYIIIMVYNDWCSDFTGRISTDAQRFNDIVNKFIL